MRSGLCFLLFGTLAWGQAQIEKSPSNVPHNEQLLAKAGPYTATSADIAPDAPVITIRGICKDSAVKKTDPSNCTTVITRSQFENLVQYAQPKLLPSDRQKFAANYAETFIRAQQAHEMGLDSGPGFEALMELRRESVLQALLGQALREKAEHVPEKDIEEYYTANRDGFEEVQFRQLYVPVVQQFPNAGMSADELQKRQQDSMLAMKNTAHELWARAMSGEDFDQLQGEAYKAAGYASKSAPVKVETQKRRRSNMRTREELSLMNLKPGEVSAVFEQTNGHFIYKVEAKRIVPLEEVRNEILQKLSVERLQQYQRESREAAHVSFDEKYFAVTSSSGTGEP